jgi:uncharacterized protein YbbC (DUF1343 family)
VVAAKRQAPAAFAWRQEPYEFVAHPIAFDLLNGTSRVREAIDTGANVDDLLSPMEGFRRDFLEHRRPFLVYGDA